MLDNFFVFGTRSPEYGFWTCEASTAEDSSAPKRGSHGNCWWLRDPIVKRSGRKRDELRTLNLPPVFFQLAGHGKSRIGFGGLADSLVPAPEAVVK